jgi:hypothetical protein
VAAVPIASQTRIKKKIVLRPEPNMGQCRQKGLDIYLGKIIRDFFCVPFKVPEYNS